MLLCMWEKKPILSIILVLFAIPEISLHISNKLLYKNIKKKSFFIINNCVNTYYLWTKNLKTKLASIIIMFES